LSFSLREQNESPLLLEVWKVSIKVGGDRGRDVEDGRNGRNDKVPFRKTRAGSKGVFGEREFV
jgi:hypothetical protein